MPQIAASAQFGFANQTSVFFVDTTGALQCSSTTSSGSQGWSNAWSQPSPIAPAKTFFPFPFTDIAVSNQFGIPDQTDVFAVNRAGQLTVYWINPRTSGWQGPAVLSTSLPAGGPVAASNQFGIPLQTDVFVVDSNSNLEGFACFSQIWNPSPFPIGQNAGAGIAVSLQFGIPNQTDLFYIDNDSNFNVFWVTGADSWSGPVTINVPSNHTLCPGGQIAVSNELGQSSQTDVFTVDEQGNLLVASVVSNAANLGWSSLTPIGPQGMFYQGGPIAASPRFGTSFQTDVYLRDTSGNLQDLSVTLGKWSSQPVQINPSSMTCYTASPIAVCQNASDPYETNVFSVDDDSKLSVFWADGGGTWQGPVLIAQL